MNDLPRIEALDLRHPTEATHPTDEFVWDWPTAPMYSTAAPAPAQEAGDGRGEKEERTQ